MESAQSPPSRTAPCWVTNEQPKTENKSPAGVHDDLNMKAGDVAAPVTPALWSVSQRIKKEIRCHLILMIDQSALHLKKVKQFVLCIKPMLSIRSSGQPLLSAWGPTPVLSLP